MEGSYKETAHNRYPTTADSPLTKRDLQNLLQEATAEIKAYTKAELNRQIQSLKADLEALSHRTDHAEAKLTKLADTTSSHSQDITYLHGKLAALEEEIEDLNNRSRRNNIRVRGLPETVTNDQLQASLTDLFNTLLPEATQHDLAMDRAHRALRPLALNPDTPRDVIVRMHRFPIKEQLVRQARQNPPTFQQQTIALYQDLAPSTLKKRRDLRQLTNTLSHHGIRYMWGHPFKLLVRRENQTHILSNAVEMIPFAESLGLTLLPLQQNRPPGPRGRCQESISHSPRRTPRKRAPPRPQDGSPQRH
ncbi:Hypothetical predicted protein [Pelobates cultripes]|uniref:L1 transposable element RRM domain-containing protein n=1 Tax=Pelobates cultripes TaxID=61616 RepID=A0AAD1RZ74_PELCU|nr:Hypothetical predicted protein [Pelobates cultripes]